ncbi:MAG: hypothetical protein AAGD35_10620 [Actinomycetota bacterium]
MLGYTLTSWDSTSLDTSMVETMGALYQRDFVPEEVRILAPDHYGTEQFRSRMHDHYITAPGFEAVTVHHRHDLVGFVTAAHLHGTGWWDPLIAPTTIDTHEDGTRTLGIFDLVIANEHRGRRLASLLHAAVLAGRTVERVSLLSSLPQQPAFTMWQRWGYEIVGRVQFEPDGPVSDLFLKPYNSH